jgi:hypothetical protein
MDIQEQIKEYITNLAEPKSGEMKVLHEHILQILPNCKLWFLDGKDDNGRTVSNPNIGYGIHHIEYSNGKTKEFYRIGISANTKGISVYIMGINDKNYLSRKFAKDIGKATLSGYCIKFNTLKDINMNILESAILYGVEH